MVTTGRNGQEGTDRNGHRQEWSRAGRNGQEWSRVGRNGQEWSRAGGNGQEWPRSDRNLHSGHTPSKFRKARKHPTHLTLPGRLPPIRVEEFENGLFSFGAEIVNGRTAMLGLVALIATERFMGHALITGGASMIGSALT